MPIYNFCAGPAALPKEVMQAASEACLAYGDSGLALIEMSHRTKEFQNILEETRTLMRELLHVPQGYSILFLGGGASMEFCRVPLNFMEHKAAYLNTGVWASKAEKEARLYGEVTEVASSADKNFSYIPKDFTIPQDADYLHITSNNTIYGTQLRRDIDSPIPVIADMSSDILSRPIDISKYAMIYGGAQKNLSIAGLSFVIVRNDALGHVSRTIPTILDYRTHIEHGSLFHTPPVLPIYCAHQTLLWIKAQGGVEEMALRSRKRATLLYDEIDRNPLFCGTAQEDSRSLMNITYKMARGYEPLANEFLSFAQDRGLRSLAGHRLAGGFRASCYNAMPLAGVEALVACMQDFAQIHSTVS